MNIYLVGNPIDPNEKYIDALDKYIHKTMDKKYPGLEISHLDPTEPLSPEPGSIFIDAVKGIKKVTIFHSLDVFIQTSGVSVHDYDLYLDLMLLSKAGKLPNITIIGVPYATKSTNLNTKLIQLIESLLV